MAERQSSEKRSPPKELEGVLFANNSQNPRAPGHWGLVTVEGVVYRIAGWVNTVGHKSKNEGAKYLRLKLQRADDNDTGEGRDQEPRQSQSTFVDTHTEPF
jgi:hypothetical protein